MRIWGKLIGFVIGLVVTRGDFGAALLGLVIGHLVFDGVYVGPDASGIAVHRKASESQRCHA